MSVVVISLSVMLLIFAIVAAVFVYLWYKCYKKAKAEAFSMHNSHDMGDNPEGFNMHNSHDMGDNPEEI
jgi:membrane protein implicated in regulation of membrane protease activity